MSAVGERAAAVRQFNRFYTRRIGVLQESLLRSDFSLTEARVLWELANNGPLKPGQLSAGLGLDAGYVSRILANFGRLRLVVRTASPADGRSSLLSLTPKGRRAFAVLDRKSHDEVVAMINALTPCEQDRLLQSMRSIEALLGEGNRSAAPYLIRTHRPGDIGWVVQRHAELYAEEYGFNEAFEALVADIAAKFARGFNARVEQCWIAERDGERVGSVLVAAQSKTAAQLRLLLVEPSARGMGIGARLVQECIRFAAQARYKKVVLWTNSILVAARKLYQDAGFQLVREEPHHSFGCDLTGQFWELRL